MNAILSDIYIDAIKKNLEQQATFMRMFPSKPLTPDELKAMRIKHSWMEAQEKQAYALAPWLKDEVECDYW